MKKEDFDFLGKEGTKICIYGLYCPSLGSLRYIGKTTDPWRRYRSHIRDARNGEKRHVCSWIKGVMEAGGKPVMKVMKLCFSEGVAYEAEVEMIRFHKKMGADLCNLTDGGLGCRDNLFRAKSSRKRSAPPRRKYPHEARLEISKRYRIFSSEQIKEIKELKKNHSYSALGKKYGVSPGTIFLAVKDKYYGEARGTILS